VKPAYTRDSCAYCADATTGFATNGCRGCAVRAAARSPQHFEARRAGKLTPSYRVLLDALGVEHAEVKEAAQRESVR
jgi:hypothetical protein